MRLFTQSVAIAALTAALLSPATARAAVVFEVGGIVYDQGVGWGNVETMLALQAQGNNTTQAGAVLRSSLAQDVRSGNATNKSQTISWAMMQNLGIASTDYSFDMILNINENDNDLILNSFQLHFQDNTGNYLTGIGVNGVATYSGPLTIQATGGQGNAGQLFTVRFTPDQWQILTASANNRIGMWASMNDVSAGADSFYIRRAANPAAVPEPSSVVLLGMLGGVGLVARTARRRWKRKTDDSTEAGTTAEVTG